MEDGRISESSEQVADAFLIFYKKLLGTKENCTPLNKAYVQHDATISPDQAEELTKPISDSEIKDALMCVGNDKSPVPDGFNSLFFKRAWNIIGKT